MTPCHSLPTQGRPEVILYHYMFLLVVVWACFPPGKVKKQPAELPKADGAGQEEPLPREGVKERPKIE